MFKLWPDLKRDLPLFGALGLVGAFSQRLAIGLYGVTGWTLPVSFVYLVFAALALASAVTCCCALLLALLSRDAASPLDATVRHLDSRVTAVASTIGSALVGFALGSLMSGDPLYALDLLICAVLMIALAETGANAARCRSEGFATLYPLTLAIVLVILFVFVRPHSPY
jgi:hypothetical protein